MARRVLLYAVIYGSIGVAIGVLMALYTAPTDAPPKNIILKNGSASKASTAATAPDEIPEPTQVEEPN